MVGILTTLSLFLFFNIFTFFTSIECAECGDEPYLGPIIEPFEIREHPWSPYTLLNPNNYLAYHPFAASLSTGRGFMGIFKNIISEINQILTEERNTAPLVIWGRNNYNSWRFDEQKKEWYQNASTGYGVHNLWTHLFVPFNLNHYQQDSKYLRKMEDQIYTNSWARGFEEVGLWTTHRLHPRIVEPLMNFLAPYQHYFRIAVHFRATDRKNEFNTVYGQIISAAKLIHDRAVKNGSKKIVFFLSSDEWSQIKRGKNDLSETGAEIAYMPNIGRSSTDIAIHLHQPHLPEWIKYFIVTENENEADFFNKCLRTPLDHWTNTLQINTTITCQNIVDQKKVRPSYLLAVDSLLEVAMIAHSHFYVSMGGNFATGPHLLFNFLPSIQFLTPHVTTEKHMNMVKVPVGNERPLIWPCPFDKYMKRVIDKINWELSLFKE
jgi:hypothetical protein